MVHANRFKTMLYSFYEFCYYKHQWSEKNSLSFRQEILRSQVQTQHQKKWGGLWWWWSQHQTQVSRGAWAPLHGRRVHGRKINFQNDVHPSSLPLLFCRYAHPLCRRFHLLRYYFRHQQGASLSILPKDKHPKSRCPKLLANPPKPSHFHPYGLRMFHVY